MVGGEEWWFEVLVENAGVVSEIGFRRKIFHWGNFVILMSGGFALWIQSLHERGFALSVILSTALFMDCSRAVSDRHSNFSARLDEKL